MVLDISSNYGFFNNFAKKLGGFLKEKSFLMNFFSILVYFV